MNILYLTNHLNIGGITSYVLSLAKGLKLRGHNIYIASSGGQLLLRFIEEGIIYIPIPIKTKSELSPKILVSMLKLLGVVKQNNIDILHSNSRTTQVLGYMVGRLTHTPQVSTCHGFFKKRLSRRLFGCWGNKVIAISESVKEHLVGDFGVKVDDVRVIHNGIDTRKFRNQKPETREEKKKVLGLGEGQVVGIVARLSDVKGHSYLIKAMRLVIEQIPDAQLLIVGEGRMKKELVNLSKRLGIEKNVFFIPSVYPVRNTLGSPESKISNGVYDTQEVLSIMDLFVLPSLKEGLGLSLMEAMAVGLAVIGSGVGGIRNLIQDGHNGLLVKPADINGLTQAILEILRNPQKAESLGEAARIFVSQNFSLEKMVLQTERLYLECLNQRD